MHFDRKDLSNKTLIHLYEQLVFPRMIEEKMLLFLRQGKISKWFSGIGQEAISVGVTCALQPDEWIMPLHRNLGVFTARNIPLQKLFQQWQGEYEGFTKGRDRSFHFGSKAHYICGMISHLGPQLTIANGTALAAKLKDEKKVSIAFTGEGGTSEGDFHEALNVASVWDLPVIFVIENNGYGLSTPAHEQFRCKRLADRAVGYGMEGVQIDGNNILEVYNTFEGLRKHCIEKQRPYLVECMTFRMRGHEEASGTKYVPKEMFTTWMERDPIKNYERFLIEEGILDNYGLAAIKDSCREKLRVLDKPSLTQTAKRKQENLRHEELNDVYAMTKPGTGANGMERVANVRFIDAIKNGLKTGLKEFPELILMGQDIAAYGGAFKITDGFLEEFGEQRIRNTPLCESAIVGAALGLSLEGYKSVVEMQFADFVSVAFNQIVNNLAKIHYRWGQSADVVIRMPTGAGVGAGPFHSQSNEAWFVHTPGLKVVYPSTPEDAKGLLIAAIRDPNPVMYFEHKTLYRSVTGDVPVGAYEVEIGKARQVRSGDDVSIITYGMGVHWALSVADENDFSVDIIDLRTLLPFDTIAIKSTVKKTGKVLVLHEDTLTGGIGGEIASWIAQHCFEFLDAPVMRCASLDTPVPFNTELEKNFLAKARLQESLQRLVNY